MSNNIKVAIKVRPLISREKSRKVEEQWTVTQNSIVSLNPLPTPAYHFDHVFGKESSNRDVFDIIAHPIVRQSLEGFNGTIFAYGQTSSGKTHTMLGNDDDPGITVLAVRQLFEENESDRTFMIRVGYIEIYNEKVYDLLNERKAVAINQNGENDIKLTNKEVIVKDGETILNILALGNKLRKAAQTNMNEVSSRSHAIFRIIIESEDSNGDGPVRVSYLNLVDLAGSEKANDAGTSGTRLKEGNDINKSLLHLGIAIRALSEGKKFVDVRSSKLTRILQASLGGNANTAIVCNITPAAVEETASTLGFANQAKTVKNEARCNEVFTPEEAFMKQMQAEVERLKAELEQSTENEKKLRDEIARKEATFLSGKNMRVVRKGDRRKTWHHTNGDNFQPFSLTPKSHDVKTNTRSCSVSSNPPAPIRLDLLATPRELRCQPFDTPSPVQAGLKYRLGRVEKEYSDLQQFTALEKHFDVGIDQVNEDAYTTKLELELKIAREEVEKYRNQLISCQLSNGNSNGMNESVHNDEKTADSSVMSNELQAAKDQVNELMGKLAELQSVQAKERESFDQKLKAAKNAQSKAEILQAEGEITFSQYKKQTNQRINELISEVENQKLHSTEPRGADLNISKMPIKVEPENSYERTELQFELDKLKTDQVRNKKTIESLQSSLSAITNERDALKTEKLETSTRHENTIKELELELKAMVEKQNIHLSENSTLHSKLVEDLERQVKTLNDEKTVLQSEHSELSEHNSKTIENLKSQLELIELEKSEMSACHKKLTDELELQLKNVTEERNGLHSEHNELLAQRDKIVKELELQLKALQSEKSELTACHETVVKDLKSQLESLLEENNIRQAENSTLNSKIIEDLEARVKTVTEERNAIQSEHSELSARHSKIIEDLESQLKAVTDERNVLQANQPAPDCDSKALELEVKILNEEKSVLESELAEVSANMKVLESRLDGVTEEKNVLQTEHSEMSTQIMDYIEELDGMKSKLDSFADLQKMYDENLQVIEKTEEECRNFKASLLESYDKIKISMDETETLKSKISSLSVEVSNLKNSLNTQSAEAVDLAKRVQVLQQQNDLLSAAKDDGINLQQQIEELQKKHCEDVAGMEEFYQKLSEELKADARQLKNQLKLKEELVTATTDAFTTEKTLLEERVRKAEAQVVAMENIQSELSELKAELQKKHELIDGHEDIVSSLKAKFHGELQEKKQLVDKQGAVISDLKSKLATDLEAKQQLVADHNDVVADLQSKLRSESLEKQQLADSLNQAISDLKSKLEEELSDKQLLIDSHNSAMSDLKSTLRQDFQSEMQKLMAELQEKKNLIDGHDVALAELELNLKRKFETEASELKAQIKDMQEKHEVIVANFEAKSQNETIELKAALQVSQQQIKNNDEIVAKLQAELREKDANALSAKHIIESLESKLSNHEPDEQKKHSPKAAKVNVHADRKARRYSQHDESRLWLDDTIEPPKSVGVQTDPSNENCSCESMNLKIMDLKQKLAIKTAVANTLRLEMDNHPLISKNKELKRTLDERDAEIQLLLKDVEHYTMKYQREKNSRGCPCVNKITESKEVQVNFAEDPLAVRQYVDQHECTNGQHEETNGHHEEANGQNGDSNGASGGYVIPQPVLHNFEDLSQNMRVYYSQVLPVKYRDALKQIRLLEAEKEEISRKSNIYRGVAVSRRADIKKLEAELANVRQLPASNVNHDPDQPNA